MIPDEVIAEIRDRVDIVELVGRVVQLKKAGTVYKGLCPFHSENTPSFTVTPTRNTYHCFGCGVHGDAVRFLVEHEKMNFPEAVRELARGVGVEVPDSRPISPQEREARQRKRSLEERLLQVQDKLTAWYTGQLFAPAGGPVRDYLQRRGVTREAAEAFRLGFANPDKRAFDDWIADSGVDPDDLTALGVLLPPDEGWERGRLLGGGYHRFHGRLVFPIVDIRGEVRGFSARLMHDSKKTAKYVNSPETPVFTKGDQLYGAHTARSAARLEGRLVLCEGQVDVIAMWQAGVKGSAAAMGTAFTPKQARLIKRLSEQVVCVMDGDAAGQKAAFASLKPMLHAGLQVRSVTMPAGEDPDSFLRKQGPEALRTLLEDAPPLLERFIEGLATDHPADAPGRTAALRSLGPVLAAVPDELTRDLYRQQAARMLGVDLEFVDRALGDVPPPAPVPRPVERVPEFVPVFDPGPQPAVLMEAPRSLPPPPDPETRNIPQYEMELLEFIVQFPRLIEAFQGAEAHKSLTYPGLAAFFAGFYREVTAGRMPNEDRLLAEIGDARVSAVVRELQAKPPSIVDESAVDDAFSESLETFRQRTVERRYKAKLEEYRAISHTRDLEQRRAVLAELNAIGRERGRRPHPNPEGAR